MLTENIHTLKALAEALLEKEVLDAMEVDEIIQQTSSIQPAAV